MVIKKKNIIIISTLICVLITFVICISALAVTPIGLSESSQVKIVLDAGHGGKDFGVSGIRTGVRESELNLSVVKKLENYLISAGFNVILTRCSDAGLYGLATSNFKKKDMAKRKEIILGAKPDLVVSVHMNYFSLKSRRGAQVFYKGGDKTSETLAKSIQESFNLMESAVKTSSALTGDYYILNCSEYPSVIAECGFLSNSEDEALLITDSYQEDIAYAIFKGIISYFSQNSFNYFK